MPARWSAAWWAMASPLAVADPVGRLGDDRVDSPASQVGPDGG